MSSPKIEVEAYAKINLGLKVLGLRSDGYHEIDTVLLSVDLADLLTIEARPDGEITLEAAADQGLDIPLEENLVLRAAQLLRDQVSFEEGVHIKLEKQIPLGAGLGGGSSDAAAALSGLNELLKLKLDRGELMRLGIELGSDVPFFFLGGRCRARGRGEFLEKLPDLPSRSIFVLLIPPLSLSTQEVYEAADRLRGRTLSSPYPNDLEAAALTLSPELQRYREFLASRGVLFGLSGSGPTYYARFDDVDQARRISRDAEAELGCRVVLCRPTRVGCKILSLSQLAD
jgi:4-diphosphocytidyl-2-C-methyl-D-erythritol kinase